MSKDPTDNLPRTVRETGAQYVVNADGQRIAVLLPIQEYEHYLDLLDDEADSQDRVQGPAIFEAEKRWHGGAERASDQTFNARRGEGHRHNATCGHGAAPMKVPHPSDGKLQRVPGTPPELGSHANVLET